VDSLFQGLFGVESSISIWPLSTGGYVMVNAISAAATILFGVLCGELLRSGLTPLKKFAVLLLAGVVGLGLGMILSGGTWSLGPVGLDLSWVTVVNLDPPFDIAPIPLVKRIWTSSFGIYAAGWTCLLLALFYGVIDLMRFRRWAFPLVVVGMNSIAIYVMAGVLGRVIRNGLQPFVEGPLSYLVLDESGEPVVLGPIVMSLLTVAVLWLLCYWLYRHRIFFKV
jgi:predicted acyltransferase